MNLAVKYPTIFWNTANLIVESSGDDLEEDDDFIYDDEDEIEEENEDEMKVTRVKKATNYGKIAKAIGKFKKWGIQIFPPNINTSEFSFLPDVEHNSIIYGLKGLTRISNDLVKEIINNRPYSSMNDFISKIKVNKLQMINLIKSGAFDDLEKKSREKIMEEYLISISDRKEKLTLQNMSSLIKYEIIPKEMMFYSYLFSFNKYLKKFKSEDYYLLDEDSETFIAEKCDADLILNSSKILQKKWDNYYKKAMEPMRKFLKDNKDELLTKLNNALLNELKDKYAQGNISKWEMDSMNFYYHEHELVSQKDEYSNFFELPENPEIEYSFQTKNGNTINVYKRYFIVGTVLDKNKLKNTVTLLTPYGVVDVKIYKNQYSLYDKQISRKNDDGTKTILEKSWFSRGTLLLIQGIRREDVFIPKTSKNSIYPIISKIKSVKEDGGLELQFERADTE